MSAIVENILLKLGSLEAIPHRIFLVGLPSCGKTKNGKKLAKELEYTFIDTDQIIESGENMSVQEIFTHLGEDYFRSLEKKYLRQLENEQYVVISTGGGMPCFNENMEWMNTQGFTIFLNRSEEIIVDRLFQKSDKRPMTKGKSKEEIAVLIADLAKKRVAFYELSKLFV